MSERKNELILIPKYEKYMEYMLQVILKLPRTEKFNIGNAYARKALALDAQKKTAEYVATLEEGLKVDPKNKTMVKNYGLHYLKAGLAAQKAGKAEEAEDCFKKVIPLDHKQYKTMCQR